MTDLASPRVARVREPLTYQRGGRHSFFADLASWALTRNDDAKERLDRHQREMDIESRRERDAESRAWDDFLDRNPDIEVEKRVNPNTTAGTGGEFSPPKWLEGYASTAATAGRVLADVIGQFGDTIPLPVGYSSIHIPRIGTGSAADIQPANAAAVQSRDITSFDASSNVVTLGGDVDVSMQLLEQSIPPGFDVVASSDLNKQYGRNLDFQLFNGTGQNGQLLGLANIGSINTVSGSGFNSIATLWPGLGQAMAAIGNNRLMPAEAWFMAPRRWAWIGSSVDSSNRPVSSPAGNAVVYPEYPPAGGTQPVARIIGKPCWEAGAITAGSSADVIYACRPSDLLLFEGTPRYTVNTEVLSGTLQARIQLRRYVAFIGGRYPSGICTITAVPQPANF